MHLQTYPRTKVKHCSHVYSDNKIFKSTDIPHFFNYQIYQSKYVRGNISEQIYQSKYIRGNISEQIYILATNVVFKSTMSSAGLPVQVHYGWVAKRAFADLTFLRTDRRRELHALVVTCANCRPTQYKFPRSTDGQTRS